MTALRPQPRRNKRSGWRNFHRSRSSITELAGEKIQTILTHAPGNGAPIGGLKVVAESGWFAARPSGTEDIYKIYAESFQGADHLRRILEEAQTIVNDAIAPAAPSTTRSQGKMMKGVDLMKSNCTPWARAIAVVVLGFCLASCANKSPPVPEAEYSTKIVGRWQGTVGDLKETMSHRRRWHFRLPTSSDGFHC